MSNHERSSSIKIIHSSPSWLPQTQTWMYNQIRYLPEECENHIVCERTKNLDQFWLPNIHSLSTEPLWRIGWDKALRKFRFRNHLEFLVSEAKKYEANILHSHFGSIGWQNIGAAKKAQLLHLVTFYGLDVNYLPKQKSYWYKRYKTLFKSVEKVLCEGPYMAQSIRNLGCPSDKIQVHPLGIEVEKIKYQPRLWNSKEPLRVLIAASFREKKGIPDALAALGQLQKDISLEITIIGEASREARSHLEKKKILTAIQQYNLQSKVRLLGYQPHSILLEEAYKHHIFLSPSLTANDGDTEGGAPVSIIEMAATGMLIVSTLHCDIPQIIESGVTGLLTKERDINGLIQHLQWLVQNPQKWAIMTQLARKKVEENFNAKVQGQKLADIYKGLIEK
ncbi:glycosyltransferase [Oscillatoria acuminata]|uniref:Glycosyltransferase n=1 Tax=Oscillatoria acuminata PCC 6304 TaxID=56110 RepID=K9TFT1_9CYAN|nr:glycosyltransferase [Oscillatoria acuminata]AFY81400.1 glycosyltransferase [Oscillatoria acuminata PCC 6304]